jgi:hypothetical protein
MSRLLRSQPKLERQRKSRHTNDDDKEKGASSTRVVDRPDLAELVPGEQLSRGIQKSSAVRALPSVSLRSRYACIDCASVLRRSWKVNCANWST